MLQQEEPEDYVIATSETHSVREFLMEAFNEIGISNFEIITSDGDIGFITNENIKWTRKTNTSFKEGDIIYVKKKQGSNEYILKQLPTANGAIVVMDPYNGRVLALSGGFSFNQSEFNRATQAQRQPGSAFKPFVYAAALENGYSPSTLVLDAPLVLEQGTDLKMWKPENYGKKFYGPSTLRKGMVVGNVQSGKTANYIGLISKAADAGYKVIVVLGYQKNEIKKIIKKKQIIAENF